MKNKNLTHEEYIKDVISYQKAKIQHAKNTIGEMEANIEVSEYNKFVKEFHEKNPDLKSFNLAEYLKALHNSKEDLNIPLLLYIFSLDIDFTAKTSKGTSAFMVGLTFKNVWLSEMFINKGIAPNEPLILKVDKEKYIQPMNYLNHVDGEYKDEAIVYPLEFACQYYCKENIELLVKHAANFDGKIEELLRLNSQMVKDAAIEENIFDLIIPENDTDLVKYIFKELRQRDENFSDDTLIDYCLRIAVDQNYKDNIDTIEYLLSIRPNKSECYIDIIQIINDGNLELIKKFVTAGLELDEAKYNDLFRLGHDNSNLDACCNVDNSLKHDIAKFLIENGANVNYQSPLMKSLGNEDIDFVMAKLLIKNGADLNYADQEGKSILMSAVSAKNGRWYEDDTKKYDLVKLLIEKGANIHHKDEKNNSILMYISDAEGEKEYLTAKYFDEGMVPTTKEVFDSEKIMKYLIEKGVDVNAKNHMGMTPLMHHSLNGEDRLVTILLDAGADINAKSEMTAFDLGNDEIKSIIKGTQNNNPQKLVKLLSNFTIDKPIKFTTHIWDFGSLKDEYSNFEGYMNAVKKQFQLMSSDLEELSPRLYKKIYTFLLEENPDKNYSWCSKTDINLGWSSLEGLQEWSDNGNNPFEFQLSKSYIVEDQMITKFGEVVELFKQEIEIRKELNNLENIFISIGEKLNSKFQLQMNKLGKQFYTDTEALSNTLNKIFSEIQKREDCPNIEVTATLPESEYIELRIVQIDSLPQAGVQSLLKEVENGDFADIKSNLTNLCDWAIEGTFEDGYFRINYLKSNNLKDIEKLEQAPKGFTHILRFYI